MPFDIHLTLGESLITRARNNAVAIFLENEAWTHLIWIDADIGFRPQALLRLLLSDYEISAGIYPIKTEHWPDGGPRAGMSRNEFVNTYASYPVNTGHPDDDVVHTEISEDGFIKLREAPTGLMCIKRGVFDKLIAAYPDLKYRPDSRGIEDRGLHYRFFDVSVDPISKRYLSEDYTFCRLWEALGGSIYLDAMSNLTHQGFKTYTGDYAATLCLNLAGAMGAVEGKLIKLTGLDHLNKFR